jgi:membrane-associated phospholipid phosphatase
MLKHLLQKHRVFISLWLGFALIGISSSIVLGKAELHLAINHALVHPAISPFLVWSTHLGDGLFLAIAAAALCIWHVRSGLYLGLVGALSGITTQMLKRNIFDNHYRPSKYFEILEPQLQLNYIEGLDLHSLYSFPSGHATVAFSLAACFALISANKKWDIAFFSFGLFIAFTRVYISQHFVEDLVAGSFIALVYAFGLAPIFLNKQLLKFGFLEKGLRFAKA